MNLIRLGRVISGMTMDECAKKCGWSIGTQCDIEKGRKVLELDKIKALEDALDIDLSNFVKRDA